MLLTSFFSRSCKRYSSSRKFSHGALAGGFTKEALQQWATNEWKDTDTPHVEFLYERIPNECIDYLNEQDYPSSELAKLYFGSLPSILKRTLMTSIFFEHSKVPDIFSVGEKYLVWKVVVQNPLEIILTWELDTEVKGCTMIAYDPKLCRLYTGNAVNSLAAQKEIFKSTKTIQNKCSKFLLSGVVQGLESKTKILKDC
jgi:hypothetical protein